MTLSPMTHFLGAISASMLERNSFVDKLVQRHIFLGLEQNFSENVVTMTDSQESVVAMTLSLTTHFIGETSALG